MVVKKKDTMCVVELLLEASMHMGAAMPHWRASHLELSYTTLFDARMETNISTLDEAQH